MCTFSPQINKYNLKTGLLTRGPTKSGFADSHGGRTTSNNALGKAKCRAPHDYWSRSPLKRALNSAKGASLPFQKKWNSARDVDRFSKRHQHQDNSLFIARKPPEPSK